MKVCRCFGQSAVEIVGLCDPRQVTLFVEQTEHYECNELGTWTQISIPEVLRLPDNKPDIGTIDKVFVDVKVISKRVVDTPVGPCPTRENAEGTRLTGKKMVVEGVLKQKVVYTAALPTQPVFSAHFEVPFSAFIVLAPDADHKEFCVETCVEDVFAIPFNCREIFKNVTLFLQAKPFNINSCIIDR